MLSSESYFLLPWPFYWSLSSPLPYHKCVASSINDSRLVYSAYLCFLSLIKVSERFLELLDSHQPAALGLGQPGVLVARQPLPVCPGSRSLLARPILRRAGLRQSPLG